MTSEAGNLISPVAYQSPGALVTEVPPLVIGRSIVFQFQKRSLVLVPLRRRLRSLANESSGPRRSTRVQVPCIRKGLFTLVIGVCCGNADARTPAPPPLPPTPPSRSRGIPTSRSSASSVASFSSASVASGGQVGVVILVPPGCLEGSLPHSETSVGAHGAVRGIP